MMKSNSTHWVFGTLILEIRLVIGTSQKMKLQLTTVNLGPREYFKK